MQPEPSHCGYDSAREETRSKTRPVAFNIKEEPDKLRGEMRQHPLLKNAMRIRDGETSNIGGITEMLQEFPDGVVLVDFIYVDVDKPLKALCYRKGLTYSPALMHDVSMDTLTARTKNLAKPSKMPLGDVTSGRECLSELTPLLLPLFKVGRGSPNQNLGPVIQGTPSCSAQPESCTNCPSTRFQSTRSRSSRSTPWCTVRA